MASDVAHHSHGPQLDRLLELDARIHSEVLDRALAIMAGAVPGSTEVRRVLDVGAGTGTGTVALAHRFPLAEVVAIDVDERMLERVRERAGVAGVGERIRTLRADIGGGSLLPGSVDAAWSASALHEVADPDQAFHTLFEALRPGGVLAVVEMDAPPRVLPAAYTELEDRVRTAGGAGSSADHPDWAPALRGAGFAVLDTHRLDTDVTLPADGPAGEYAALELRRIGHAAMPALSEADRAALLQLAGTGAGNVRSLGEVWIRGTRTVWAARRP